MVLKNISWRWTRETNAPENKREFNSNFELQAEEDRKYLDHLFVNPYVSIGMKIGNVEVSARRRRLLSLQRLLLSELVGNPNPIGQTVSSVRSSTAIAASFSSAKRAETGDSLLFYRFKLVETVAVIAARLHILVKPRERKTFSDDDCVCQTLVKQKRPPPPLFYFKSYPPPPFWVLSLALHI